MGDGIIKAVEAIGEAATAVGVAAAPVTGGASLAAAGAGALLAKLPAFALDKWRSHVFVKEEAKFAKMLWGAHVLIEDGDDQMAYDHLDAHMQHENFRKATFAAATKMREWPPVDEALAPLSTLVAHYYESRPDAEYRRWLGFLCDVTAEELEVLRKIVIRHRDLGIPEFDAQIRCPGESFATVLRAHYGIYGKASPTRLEVAGASKLCSMLADHDLATAHQTTGQQPGAGTEIFDTAPETLLFAAKLLGVVPPDPAE